MELGLQLLMRDGAVQVAFHPHLTVEQYAEFLKMVERATTRLELSAAAESAARRWGIEVEIAEIGV